MLRAGDASSYARTLLLLSERGGRLTRRGAGAARPEVETRRPRGRTARPRRTSMTRVSRLRFTGLAAGLLAI